MNDMIEALHPTIQKLANKIDGSTCNHFSFGDEMRRGIGRISQPAIRVNWRSHSEHIGTNLNWHYWLIIDAEGIRFHQECDTSHDYRIATQNVQWTDPELLQKIKNILTKAAES